MNQSLLNSSTARRHALTGKGERERRTAFLNLQSSFSASSCSQSFVSFSPSAYISLFNQSLFEATNIGDGQPGSWGEGRRGGEAGAIRWLKRRGGLSVPWETYTEGAGSLRGVPVARAHMELAKHGEGCLGFLVLALIAGVILSFTTMTLVRRGILIARILVARILIARILVASEVLTYLK